MAKKDFSTGKEAKAALKNSRLRFGSFFRFNEN